MTPKKGMTTNFFHQCLSLLFFGSEIRDPGWVKIRIGDKHPGSPATLITNYKQYNLAIWHELWLL
jgi:hypothetical protein